MNSWIVRWGLARLREPSTWRGLIALATAFGVVIRPEVADALITLGLALIGGINVATPEPVRPPRDAGLPGRVRDDLPTPHPDAPVRDGAFKDLDRFE